jgi:hypothetical protein
MPKPKQPPVPTGEPPTNGSASPDKAPRIIVPEGGPIIVPRMRRDVMEVKVIGLTSLITNPVSNKYRQEMIEKGQVDEGSAPKQAKKARDYEQEYRDTLYPLPGGGYSFPAIGFKRAIVGACRQVDGLDMTTANRIIFVEADDRSRGQEVVRILGEPAMREDIARTQDRNRVPMPRFRAEFKEWSATLRITFVSSMIGHS